MPIGFDLGSSSAKALFFERHRQPVIGRRAIATRRRSGGRVDHDAELVLAASLAALRYAGRAVDPHGGAVALGIATQRSTVLFWDRATGRPLTPAYSWQDRRASALCARAAGRRDPRRFEGLDPSEAVALRSGLRLGPHYSASKIAWALRHVSGLRRRVAAGRALWGTLGTFLLWHLSGGSVYAADHANAQRTLLLDLHRLAWDPDLFSLFGLESLLDAPALPALVPTFLASPLTVRLGGRLLQPRAMTGDQQAALIGLHCRRIGDVAINYGSGAFVLLNLGGRPRRVQGLLTTLVASWSPERVGNRSVGRGYHARYAVEGPVNSALTALDWVTQRLGLQIRTRDLDDFLGPDLGRPRAVHFLPAVAGLGAPRWDSSARPRFSGDVAGASPRDLLRAAVDSIAMRCAEIVRAAGGAGDGAGTGDSGAPVRVAGGLTRCRSLLQAQADLLQRPILIVSSPDATAFGAALMAGETAHGAASMHRLHRPGGSVSRERRHGRDRGLGREVVFPRLPRDEAEARYRSWERAVYG